MIWKLSDDFKYVVEMTTFFQKGIEIMLNWQGENSGLVPDLDAKGYSQ